VVYDTVIIGAGLSGLAAGIRLAYFERSVCILEKHTKVGGLNSFYRLRKRDHDVGLHAVTNYAPPGTKTGPLSKLLRQLRLSWDDFGLKPQKASAIKFGDCTLEFNNEFEFLFQQIADRFPKDVDGFRNLLKRIEGYEEVSLTRKFCSARQVVGEHISDPLLAQMLFCPLLFYGSATPRDMDFGQFVILFKSIFYEGFARPSHGVRRILDSLVGKFKSLGGELRLRRGVRSIKVENNRAVGVELANGEIIEARNVLSSAGAAETMRLCPEAPADSHPRPGEISFVETIFSLDRPPEEFGHDDTIVFYNDSDDFRYERPETPVDVRSGIICSPNNFQFDEPSGDGRIRITALADPGYWIQLPRDEYKAEKQRWAERIVESALRYVPDFRSFIVDTDMFTPRTIKKYTGHLNGCVYGAPDKALDGKSRYENLYLCGTDQGFLGIIGAMLSGISIANAYLLKHR